MNAAVEEKLKQALAGYLAMDKYEQKDFESQVRSAWSKVHEDYIVACENDEELCKLYDEIKRVKGIISFDLEDCFTVYSYTANEGDPEFEEPVYVYSPKKFAEAKHLSDTWQAEEKRILSQIEDVKNARIYPFREKKIARLEKELELKKEIVAYYKRCMAKQEEKDYYLDNRSKLLDPLVKRHDELLNKYAKEALKKHLKENPIIICTRQEYHISSSNHPRSFNSKVLNNQANEIRDELKKKLVVGTKR